MKSKYAPDAKDPWTSRCHISEFRDRRVASVGAIPILNSERETRSSDRTRRAETLAAWMRSREKKPYPAKSSLIQVKKLIQVRRPGPPLSFYSRLCAFRLENCELRALTRTSKGRALPTSGPCGLNFTLN